MALTYLGATSFAQSGPEQWRLGQFELDQMSVPFSGAATGLTTYVSSLTRGSAWSGDANMFLAGWSVSDSNKQYPTVTLEYLGAKGGVLPPAKSDYDDQVQSASSQRSAAGIALTAPLVVQYYAPSIIYSWITANAPGDPASATIPDPTNNTRVITLTCADTTFSTGPVIDAQIAAYFLPRTVDTFTSTELVRDAKYYQNVARRTKFLSPWIFNLAPGAAYLSLYSPGNGYSAGDILTVSGSSGFGTVQVDSVGGVFGGTGILNYTQLSAMFTASENALPAIGGSGTGAGFNVWVLP